MSGSDELAGVVLAAGAGLRLRPLTTVLPKPLCPVGNVPLVDLAINRAHRHTRSIAVNVHHGRPAMETHLTGRVHLSIEDPAPLGTAGAVARLLGWIDGRDLLVVNADAWHEDDLDALVSDGDPHRCRLLCVRDEDRPDFRTKSGALRYAGAARMPWRIIRDLPAEVGGLYEMCWRPLIDDGAVDFVVSEAPFYDCGTPRDYHAANMAASGGKNVVGEGARVDGVIVRTVVWTQAVVERHERLTDAVRATASVTVFV